METIIIENALLVWMKVEEYYNNVSDIYDSLYRDETSIKENNIVKNILNNNINKHDKILDLGCGTGLFLELYYNYNYIGIDCSKKMVDIAKRKYPFNVFINADIDKGIDYPDKMFDVVVSLFSSASHFKNLQNTVNEANRILCNNGYILLMVLSQKNGKYVAYNTRNAPKVLGNTDATTYTENELKDIFKDFKDLKIYYLTELKHTLVVEGKKCQNER